MSMLRVTSLFVVLCAIFAASMLGCSQTTVITPEEANAPDKEGVVIHVYWEPPTDVKYQELGMVTVKGGSEKRLLTKLHNEAKKLGGNAMIVKRLVGDDWVNASGFSADGQMVMGNSERQGVGQAVVIKTEE